jgi:hypothetical protein
MPRKIFITNDLQVKILKAKELWAIFTGLLRVSPSTGCCICLDNYGRKRKRGQGQCHKEAVQNSSLHVSSRRAGGQGWRTTKGKFGYSLTEAYLSKKKERCDSLGCFGASMKNQRCATPKTFPYRSEKPANCPQVLPRKSHSPIALPCDAPRSVSGIAGPSS